MAANGRTQFERQRTFSFFRGARKYTRTFSFSLSLFCVRKEGKKLATAQKVLQAKNSRFEFRYLYCLVIFPNPFEWYFWEKYIKVERKKQFILEASKKPSNFPRETGMTNVFGKDYILLYEIFVAELTDKKHDDDDHVTLKTVNCYETLKKTVCFLCSIWSMA